MDKKGQMGWAMMFLIIIVSVVVGSFVLYSVRLQHGTSRDIVMGYDKGIIWHHAYLKNDHSTAYCFNDEKFIPMLEQSQKDQKEVIVTYETYVLKGSLCSASKNYETVIITNVEWADASGEGEVTK